MKHLAIDIGQVICHLDFTKFNSKLAEYAEISEKDAYDFLLKSQKAHDLGFSVLEKDLADKIYGLNLKPEQVIDIVKEWHDTIRPNAIVMTWLEELLADNTEIALVSNIGIEHAEAMKTLLAPIYNHPKVIKFFSCFVGARKPTYVYFQTFLNMYPQFQNCVYVDDNADNIESGKLFNFKTVQFDLSKIADDNELASEIARIEDKIYE